jgi:hypothetical protein
MLSPFQFGFRKLHSTSHALIAITDYIYNALDNNNVCIFISLDIKRAFDMASKEVLCHKLSWYGVETELIESFLTDRSQYVCLCSKEGSNISDTLSTNLGCPQGLCLSCLLFLIIMNDLPYHLKNSLSILFADDTGLVISGKIEMIDEIIKKVECDLNNVCSWMKSNRQELNVNKCMVMMICNKKDKVKLENTIVNINGIPLRRVKSIKMLGVVIDEDLNFNEQCKSVAKKCYGALWSLRPLKYVLSDKYKLIVIQALVHSLLKYGCVVWLMGSKNTTIIDKVIRSCARFVSCKLKYDSISDEINEYGWLYAKNMVKFELCKMYYKIMNESCPDMFKNYFNGVKETICTRSSKYMKPGFNCNKAVGKKAFKYRAQLIWLNLPDNIRNEVTTTNFNVFKKTTKDEFLCEQYNDRMNVIIDMIDEYEFENM